MAEQCGNCRFWKSNEDGSGSCRRHAPWPERRTIEPGRDHGFEHHDVTWPLMLADDWCGEFQPKPVRQ